MHKQVQYYQSLQGCKDKLPARVYAYIANAAGGANLALIPATDFAKYEFIEYTYEGSFYPKVKAK